MDRLTFQWRTICVISTTTNKVRINFTDLVGRETIILIYTWNSIVYVPSRHTGIIGWNFDWHSRLVGTCLFQGFHEMKQKLLECSEKQWEAFPINIVQTTIHGSHKIWVTRNWLILNIILITPHGNSVVGIPCHFFPEFPYIFYILLPAPCIDTQMCHVIVWRVKH